MQYFRTILILAKSLTFAFLRDKTGLFFTFAFPLMFLLVFGGLFAGSDDISFNVALVDNTETEFGEEFVNQLKDEDIFSLERVEDVDEAEQQLGRGEYSVILELEPSFGTVSENGIPRGNILAYFDEADQQLQQAFTAIMEGLLDNLNQQFIEVDTPFALETRSLQTANLSQFDYVFAGLLGFTMLSLGFFGLSSTLPVEKKTGVLRRLRSTPLRPLQLILAVMLQYLLLGLISVALMFIVGVMVFDFNMRGDFLSFGLFSVISIISMFGFGLAIGGWAKNENQAAPISNILAFPMMFLSGVFFPRFIMPEWLQAISQYIPLSPIVDGLRLIITESRTLLELGPELTIIATWTLTIYVIASKTFRWE